MTEHGQNEHNEHDVQGRRDLQNSNDSSADLNAGLASFEERIGYRFNDKDLLERALSHSSWAVEKGGPSNQRLEFLGDAVVDLVVSELLMGAEHLWNEGEMTRLRASVVSSQGLAEHALSIDLGRWVLLGRGETKNGGADKPKILADTYEAVVGAVFLDGGYEAAKEVVR